MITVTGLDLFAGIPVSDRDAASVWYEKLFGAPPSFHPNEREAVWRLAEHRYVYVELRPDSAGHGKHTAFLSDLDAVVAGIAERGLRPVRTEDYDNGVRKVTYADPDGNEFGFGGAVS